MGADLLYVKGRLKTSKENYENVKNVLVNGLSQHLSPNNESNNLLDCFDEKENFLELNIYDALGNPGRALKYMEKDFAGICPDVCFEMLFVEYYSDCVSGDRLYYDGEKMTKKDIYVDERGIYLKWVKDKLPVEKFREMFGIPAEDCEDEDYEMFIEEEIGYDDLENLDYEEFTGIYPSADITEEQFEESKEEMMKLGFVTVYEYRDKNEKVDVADFSYILE